MKPVWKYISISFFALLVVGYIGFTLWHFNGKEKEIICTDLNINLSDKNERQLVTSGEIAQILEQNGLNPIGKTLTKIRTESIEVVLKKNPYIKTAECFTTPSGITNINISQRCPKFQVIGNENYYIDVDRKPLPISLHFAAYVPVVSGRVTLTMATGKLFDFIDFLEKNSFWNAQIEQIYVRNDLKIELVPRVGDAIVLLGTLDNYPAKLEKLRKLYIYGFNKMGWNRYKTIDLEYKDLVVCTKAGKSEKDHPLNLSSIKGSVILKKL